MFYKKLNGGGNNENTDSTPNKNENRELWKKIWGINKVQNKDAERLSKIPELLNLDREEDIITSKKDFKKTLQKLPHWKAHGKDGLQGYWIKAFKSLHDQLLNRVKPQTGWYREKLYSFRKILVKVLSQAITDPLHACQTYEKY